MLKFIKFLKSTSLDKELCMCFIKKWLILKLESNFGLEIISYLGGILLVLISFLG